MGVFCLKTVESPAPAVNRIGKNQQHCKQQLMSKYEMSEEETYIDAPLSTKVSTREGVS